MFNIVYVSQPTSYWAIIMPLFLSVDMLNDSMILHANKSVERVLFKENARFTNEESKANGTFEHDAILDFVNRMVPSKENRRRAIKAPAGFEEFRPKLFVEDSKSSAVKTMIMEYVNRTATSPRTN
jgi:hypothetical protein